MKNPHLFLLAILLCLYNSAHAFELPPEPCPLSQDGSQNREVKIAEIPKPAALLVGNVSAALMAADYNKVDNAIAHLGLARQNIKDLENIAPDFTTVERMQVSRLDYVILPHTGQWHRVKHYALFPFEDGVVTAFVPDIDRRTRKYLGINPRNAKTEFVSVQWDLSVIKSDLEMAVIALSHRDSIAAAKFLHTILSRDIVIVQEADAETLQSVDDHIMLANSLLQSRDYLFSRYALYHAQMLLKQYNTCSPFIDEKQVELLSHEIESASQELRKEDPGTIESIKGKMRRWNGSLQKWIHTAPVLDRS